MRFMRAVASQLNLDAPEGAFESTPGVKAVPSRLPLATRTALLQAAVSAEAEPLKPVERANAVTSVANSMVRDLVDRAAALGSATEKIAALESLGLFVDSAQQVRGELSPDVEASQIVYDGPLRQKQLDDLFGVYLDVAVEEVQQQTNSLLASMMKDGPGAADAAFPDMQEMEARAEQSQKKQDRLAVVLKVPERKAQKLMESKMKVMQEEAQKQLLANLGNFGG